jgi:hypothetical protein
VDRRKEKENHRFEEENERALERRGKDFLKGKRWEGKEGTVLG